MTTRKKPVEQHIYNKRDELVWSMSSQNYTLSQIAWIFGISKTLIFNILKRKPKDWSSPWMKIK